MVLLVVTDGRIPQHLHGLGPQRRPQGDRESSWASRAVTLGWVQLAYILGAAALLMPVGRMADTFGRKRLFLIGISAFSVLVLAGALAPSAPVLIALRLFQGFAHRGPVRVHDGHGHPRLSHRGAREGAGAAGGRRVSGADAGPRPGRADHRRLGLAVHLRLRGRPGRHRRVPHLVAAARGRVERAETGIVRYPGFDRLGGGPLPAPGGILAAPRHRRLGDDRRRRRRAGRVRLAGDRGRPTRC